MIGIWLKLWNILPFKTTRKHLKVNIIQFINWYNFWGKRTGIWRISKSIFWGGHYIFNCFNKFTHVYNMIIDWVVKKSLDWTPAFLTNPGPLLERNSFICLAFSWSQLSWLKTIFQTFVSLWIIFMHYNTFILLCSYYIIIS